MKLIRNCFPHVYYKHVLWRRPPAKRKGTSGDFNWSAGRGEALVKHNGTPSFVFVKRQRKKVFLWDTIENQIRIIPEAEPS